MLQELELPLFPKNVASPGAFISDIRKFRKFGSHSIEIEIHSSDRSKTVPAFVNEFWTAAQRDADNLHEVSYRACFKPQLPRFFAERLTAAGDVVYDPFMGRGTTLLEAALLGRVPAGNDINPLSLMLIKPRLNPSSATEIERRLKIIPWNQQPSWPKISADGTASLEEELLVFYHPETLAEIISLKNYLEKRRQAGELDGIDEWIRMVAINRLTGHSGGFFSVYTLPPNQAVSIKSQKKINTDRNQSPPRRDVPRLILKKSLSLLKDLDQDSLSLLRETSRLSLLSNAPARKTPGIPSNHVSLVVTSPPFLDVVNYALDNWLRCWFAGIDPATVNLTVPGQLEVWEAEMTAVFRELHRILKPGGHIAFEVGEVRKGAVRLEETVLTCGLEARLEPVLVLINQQEFTKTANCWGVDNNAKGTNSNRIVVFQKPR